MTKDNYQEDKKSAIGWVAGVVAVLLTSGLGFLATQLVAHETALAVVKERQTTMEQRLNSMDSKLDKILDRVTHP